MIKNTLNDREFELINIIGSELANNQRDLSRHLNISLGTTNMIIRRLIDKGYIRIRPLRKRKVEYTLTPKGFSERLEQSIHSTLKTLHSIKQVKQNIRDIIRDCYARGERMFFACGDDDISFLMETVFKEPEFQDCTFRCSSQEPFPEAEGVVFICQPQPESWMSGNGKRINLIEMLAKKVNDEQ